MKKTGIIFLILMFSVNVFAQDAKEIVEKCVNAFGGEAAIKKLSDYKAKGEIKVSVRGMELSGKLEAIQKGRKIWRRAEINFGGDVYVMLQAFDGQTAWMDRQGTIVDQPSLNYDTDLSHDISLLVEKDADFSLAKEKEIEGKKSVGIEVSFKDKKTTFFIDKQTNTILEMVYKDLYFGEKYTKEMLERRIKYAEYKELDGVLFPTKVTIYQRGKKLVEFQYEEVQFGPEVAFAKFQRPDQELDLRYREELIH